jgi:sporulation-control protein spo0M
MNIWVAEYKDEAGIIKEPCYTGVYKTQIECEHDHTYFNGMEFVRAVEFVPEETPRGKQIDRVNKDNWFLNIEKDSLQRFISKRGLLDAYKAFAEADVKASEVPATRVP